MSNPALNPFSFYATIPGKMKRYRIVMLAVLNYLVDKH